MGVQALTRELLEETLERIRSERWEPTTVYVATDEGVRRAEEQGLRAVRMMTLEDLR